LKESKDPEESKREAQKKPLAISKADIPIRTHLFSSSKAKDALKRKFLIFCGTGQLRNFLPLYQ
jgi:hypothetical protein